MNPGHETFAALAWPVKTVVVYELPGKEMLYAEVRDSSDDKYVIRVKNAGEALLICNLLNWMNEAIDSMETEIVRLRGVLAKQEVPESDAPTILEGITEVVPDSSQKFQSKEEVEVRLSQNDLDH